MFSIENISPSIAPTAWLAPTAVLIGDVTIGEHANLWFGAVLRGDYDTITVGHSTSVQDNVVVHAAPGHPTRIGDEVVVGHAATLEGCTIGAGTLIGMGATVLREATVGPGTVIAAGATVAERAQIPAGVIAAGVPARVLKPLSGEFKLRVEEGAAEYRALAARYQREGIGSAVPSQAGAGDEH